MPYWRTILRSGDRPQATRAPRRSGPPSRASAMTKRAQATELVVQGDRAALLYDCELPPPVGVIKIASFFRVANGKIRWYETLFDATELRKLQAQQRAGS